MIKQYNSIIQRGENVDGKDEPEIISEFLRVIV